MTYREKLQKEHPEKTKGACVGGCEGCPDIYGYCKRADTMCGKSGSDIYNNTKCTRCWDQEIPGTEKKKTKRIPPDTKKEWKATDAVFKDGHREKIFYCEVNNEDFIEFATKSGMYVYFKPSKPKDVTLYSNSKPTLTIKENYGYFNKIHVCDEFDELRARSYVYDDIDHIEFEEVEVDE